MSQTGGTVFHDFEAMGTVWHVQIEDFFEKDVPAVWQTIENETAKFERRFSRFIPDSEACQFRVAKPGTYPVSKTFLQLLQYGDRLRKISGGVFDPAVGMLLEALGYDSQYSFKKDTQKVTDWKMPAWSISQTTSSITIDGPVVFDVGGYGKGYWIDQLAGILLGRGYSYFLIDGGADMFATTKADGSGFQIALRWPGKDATAVGKIELKNAGFAASDRVERNWGESHHIVDANTKNSVEELLGAYAVAKDATTADSMTSLLMLGKPEEYPMYSSRLEAQYLVLSESDSVKISSDWPGEVFSV